MTVIMRRNETKNLEKNKKRNSTIHHVERKLNATEESKKMGQNHLNFSHCGSIRINEFRRIFLLENKIINELQFQALLQLAAVERIFLCNQISHAMHCITKQLARE